MSHKVSSEWCAIIEVPKYLADSPSVATHTIQLADPIDAVHPLIISFQFSSVTSYFDVYSLSVAEYGNKEVPKIHVTAEESPWDP